MCLYYKKDILHIAFNLAWPLQWRQHVGAPVRSVLMKKLICLVAGIASLAVLTANGVPAAAQAQPTIKLGYAKCAHCTPLALLPPYSKGVQVEAISLYNGHDDL